MELRDASLFTPVRQVELWPKALAVEGAPRAKVRAELRDHFSDMRALQAQEDPEGADAEPYELLVPGGELPSSFMPVGRAPAQARFPRPNELREKLLWRPQGEPEVGAPDLRPVFEDFPGWLGGMTQDEAGLTVNLVAVA